MSREIGIGTLPDDAPLVPVQTACAQAVRVASVRHPCHEHVAISLAADSFPASAPGQFLQLLCHATEDSAAQVHAWPAGAFPRISDPDFAGTQAYLRRPFSIADREDRGDETHLTVISRAVGVGTTWLDRLRAGDTVDITGPLGRGFDIPPAHVPVVLVGGGVGIPPLLYLTRVLHDRGHADATLIVGARTRDLLPVDLREEPPRDAAPAPCVRLPGEAPFASIVTSDDGSVGLRGLTTDALAAWAAQRGDAARGAVVMACGPDPMLRALARHTRALGMACQLCIERNMGCGLGTCLSCVVRVRAPLRPLGWRWALTCNDGPVFDRDALPDYD